MENWEKELYKKFTLESSWWNVKYKSQTAKAVGEFIKELLHNQRIEIEMTESIKRYDQAKEDGTLDKHFPSIN